MSLEKTKAELKALVRELADFPIQGVLFRDISPILESPAALHSALEAMVEGVDLARIDHVVGIESRGFILGAALAARYEKGFIPLRKAGKLPPPVISRSYELEYGSATLEMRPGKGRVLVVDDVLATGGTLVAARELCLAAGYEVVDLSVLIDLRFLNQLSIDGRRVRSVLVYE